VTLKKNTVDFANITFDIPIIKFFLPVVRQKFIGEFVVFQGEPLSHNLSAPLNLNIGYGFLF
jgi:hypothetical protein